MFGLRQKLIFGFGGLLLILLVMSAVGIGVLEQSRIALDRFLYENWRSVEYGHGMIDALGRLNETARLAVEQGPAAGDGDAGQGTAVEAIRAFERNLNDENHNVTLPGEDKLAQDLNAAWSGSEGYKALHGRIMDAATAPEARKGLYAQLQRVSTRLGQTANNVIKLNFDNMKPVEGKAKAIADSTTRIMILLAIAGVLIGVGFIAIVGRSILQPVRALTRSAREIEQGNLDLVVQVKSHDELHDLAEAFNSMAEKLREYRRTNRAKLLRTQHTTQNAINSLPDAVAILSPDGIVEMANIAAQKLFDLKPETQVGELRLEWLSKLYQKTSQDLRPVEPRGYESAVQVLNENGGEKFFLPHAVPILDEDGQLLGVTIVLADVTHLRRLDEMKSGMLSVVSHELKTPLTSIRMGVHLMLEERIGPLTADQSQILTAVRDDSDRLRRIVDGLLDIGRLESGRALMDLKGEAVEQLVSSAVEEVTTAYKEKGVELGTELPDGLPPVLDGMGVLRELRTMKVSPKPRVVVLTAFGSIPLAVQATRLGAVDFLEKPISPDELRMAVESALSESSMVLKPDKTDEDVAGGHTAILERACDALRMSRVTDAETLLMKAADLAQSDPFYFNLLGALYETQSQWRLAKKFYGRAMTLDKHYLPPQHNMRRIYELEQWGRSSKPIFLGDETEVRLAELVRHKK